MPRPREAIYETPQWRRLSAYVRFERARGYCEECGAAHGRFSPDGWLVTFLHCAHLNGDVRDLRLENLRALCQKCHFEFDQVRRAREILRRKGGTGNGELGVRS